jgi:hypothetical protein
MMIGIVDESRQDLQIGHAREGSTATATSPCRSVTG